ncbi:MAG TPA: ABC transporter permease [Propionicimonas sp.]|jgi:ABC-2 type transport system permease protein
MSVFSDLVSSRELLANLTSREVKGKYKRTLLGQLWSLINPLAQMLIFTVVFSFVIRIQPDKGNPSGLNVFALWLMCGLLPWNFFANVLGGGMGSLVSNENLIKKVYFPRVVLPVSNAASIVVTWLGEMVVLVVALAIFGGQPWKWLPLVVVVMAVEAVFATGVSLTLSVANVYFRDVQYLVGIVLQAWFYLTPIVYPPHLVQTQSDKLGPLVGNVTAWDIYQLNPMAQFAEVFRKLLYDNTWPSLTSVIAIACWTVAAVLIGARVFARNEKRLAEAL